MKLVAGLTHSFDEVAPTPGVTLPANYYYDNSGDRNSSKYNITRT